MATLGDEGGLFVWARYKRWPLFTAIGAIVGLILGFVFAGGFIGGAAGLVGLGVTGFIFGLAMGVDSAMFPVTVEKMIKYGGGRVSFEGKYPAKVTTIEFKDSKGRVIEPRRIVYLQGTTLRQMPPFSLPNWYKDGETRNLPVLQLDTYTYRPITSVNGKLIVENVPIYAKDAEGKIIVEVDEKGEAILDANGDPTPKVVGTRNEVILDTNEEYDAAQEKMVTIPKGFAAKLDNERAAYADGIRWLYQMTEVSESWLAKNGVFIIAVVAMLAISIFGYIKFTEMVGDITTKTAASNAATIEALRQMTELNAKVSIIMLQNGFNVNTTFLLAPTTKPPEPNAPDNGINLPLVGRIGG